MALYIDSADRPVVESLLDTGLFAGVTTNPEILARNGYRRADLPVVHRWLTAAGARRVYFQTLGDDADAVTAHGREIAALGDDVIVKIPATRAGLTAAARLSGEGVPVLITAVHHATHAQLAVAAGAHSVAPYVAPMTRHGRDGAATTLAMARILAGTGVGILAAGFATPDEVAELAAGGIVDFTLEPALLETMLADEYAVAAAEHFEAVTAAVAAR
ncbi:hypothetical protein JL107_16020 [Nakamurella flavida]|uniref:Transaldolase n=1 Tax=Nakamurella flavida TaxID=363630 RepID=A0A938YNT1_9ACTN|nr:transaldolase family protein [Nakamurella flavida]MBM9477956.1 hypothetical protein [Nakamurella flavida]MDP9778328.1 TalC/MipB family fructose-6-phosphate aldolase [Nakamurella flavida]